MSQRLLVVDGFASEAKELRRVFDQRFANPRDTSAERFVWDYWHIPHQYTALRTPAYTYFPSPIYRAFHRRLVEFGRKVLGCHNISPPWLSCYVDGCGQELHADVPHGPWAFVFSLTPWKGRNFTGGETTLLRDEVLGYWDSDLGQGDVEMEQLFESVPAKFNRLTVFDPRIPHGVKRVRGTQDPKEGRLVVHGWFLEPRPFIVGPLSRRDLSRAIAHLSSSLGAKIPEAFRGTGMVSLRIKANAAGRVAGVRVLSNTLAGDARSAALLRAIVGDVKTWRFGQQKAGSSITLPLVFSSEG